MEGTLKCIDGKWVVQYWIDGTPSSNLITQPVLPDDINTQWIGDATVQFVISGYSTRYAHVTHIDITKTRREPTKMNLQELFVHLGLENKEIIAHLIKPIRKGEWYDKGRVTGFKSGMWGGGHYNYRRDSEEVGGVKSKKAMPFSYSSERNHWIKKPKVHITYNIGDFGGKQYSDWVDIDNCTFEIE